MKNHSRDDFGKSVLDEHQLPFDPHQLFSSWIDDAIAAQVLQFDAAHLATVMPNGHPDMRVVYVRDFDRRGFVFFSNYHSAKARQLDHQPYAALNFFWAPLERQVRIRGRVNKTTHAESQAYFASRPHGSKLGAWASPQSSPVATRMDLERAYNQHEINFGQHTIPCPPHWGGYRLTPEYFEFWQGRASRLHDRITYTYASDDNWLRQRLAP